MKEKGNDLIIFKQSDKPRMAELEDGTIVYSALDSVAVLKDSTNPSAYWRKLKQRLKEEGNESVTNCHRVKLPAKDGKMRYTDCVTEEQLFRLIQSIPSPKAEPFKQWLAKVGTERLEEERNPSKAIKRGMNTYKKQGRSAEWRKARFESIEERNTFTDEIESAIDDPSWQYGKVTNICYKEWSGFNTNEYKRFKNIRQRDNLRDNMTSTELSVCSLVENTVVKTVKNRNVKSYDKLEEVCHKAGKIGKNVCDEIEELTGEPVVTSNNNLIGSEDNGGYIGR